MGTSQKLRNLDIDPSMMPFKLILNNYEIRRVKKTKYLGMIVDDSLTWEDHIDYITLKINRGVGIIRRVRCIHRRKTTFCNKFHVFTIIRQYYNLKIKATFYTVR